MGLGFVRPFSTVILFPKRGLTSNSKSPPKGIKRKNPRARSLGDFIAQLLSRINRSLLTILAETLKAEHTAFLGVQSVVGADTDIDAGMDVGAALANENVAGENELTVRALGTETLGLGVTAVLGGAHTFFMGKELKTNVQHGKLPSFL